MLYFFSNKIINDLIAIYTLYLNTFLNNAQKYSIISLLNNIQSAIKSVDILTEKERGNVMVGNT